MEDLGSLWSYQENIDELKQKLMLTSFELESLKVEAIDEMRKHKEEVKHLINLLKLAYQERDEAKDQLQKLFNKLMPSSPTELHTIFPPDNSLIVPAKANSSITESSSLSDTYNHQQSHGSSPVDSFLDAAVTSPDFTSINMADSSQIGFGNKHHFQEFNGSMPAAGLVPKTESADAIIDRLVKGKALPQNGKMLQTVLEAGPLLQTLLVAGPLPRWRNPPPVQSFKIPPVSIIGCEAAENVQKPAASKISSSPSMSRGTSQLCSASMLNFANAPSCSGPNNGWLSNSGVIDQFPAGKRQRFQ